ncbi:MAG: 4-hydroxy-tetrahydrodipicolinate synthase [Myxococcales bacterium]|jgi:4-hydroxy-tetrahydrodipicolinate synthase
MTIAFQPRGVWTALVSPFGSDGKIDEARFKRLLAFQLDQGVDGVVPCGTTGESPTLSWQEHDHLIDVTVATVGDRAGVLAGTGSNNTAEAVRGSRHAAESGVSAVLLVDCYYNGPSSLELRTEYYERVLQAVPDLPIVPYVIPGRSGCALSAEDLALMHLRDPKRVPAVKQATGDMDRMRRERELCGESLAIISGDDHLTLRMMGDAAIGCSGVISVMSNLVPAAMTEMVRAQAEGDTQKAGAVAHSLAPLTGLVGCSVISTRALPDGREVEVEDRFRNPLPVKTMMAGLGMIEPVARPPLGKMTAPAVGLLRDALRQVYEATPEHLKPIEQAFDVNVGARLDDDGIWDSLGI